MENEFNRDYAGEIALECANFDNALFAALEDYNNSAMLLGGNKWYSIALEDSDSDKEKNEEGKRNILLRIIDKVVDFIKMIGKKIVEWYRACKAAIIKFFKKDTIDPVQVAQRFDLLVEDFDPKTAAKLISGMSKDSKAYLAEILSTEYAKVFSKIYEDFLKIGEKSNSVKQFISSHDFFSEFKEHSSQLKLIAQKNSIYEGVDESLKKLLAGSIGKDVIKNVITNFNTADAVHKTNAAHLEKLLKQIPQDDLEGLDGDNPAVKRQNAVKLISDVIKVNSEIVLKVNNHMQAAVMLMTLIVKTRARKVSYIPM